MNANDIGRKVRDKYLHTLNNFFEDQLSELRKNKTRVAEVFAETRSNLSREHYESVKIEIETVQGLRHKIESLLSPDALIHGALTGVCENGMSDKEVDILCDAAISAVEYVGTSNDRVEKAENHVYDAFAAFRRGQPIVVEIDSAKFHP